MKCLSLVAALLLLIPSAHRACARCYVPTPGEALRGAQAVFVGKVLSVGDPGTPTSGLSFKVVDLTRPVRVRFAVERLYRGKKVREVEVHTRMGGLEWGYEFSVGERYLVYAQGGEAVGQGLVVGGCGRTRLVAEAEEELRFLGKVAKARGRRG